MSDLPVAFDHYRYCDLVEGAVEEFASVTRGADMSKQVPTCPEWTMAELIRHTGQIHRWVTQMVATLTPDRLKGPIELGLPDDDSWLPGWLSAGGKLLVETLRAADPNSEMWAWGPDQRVGWWSRRMVHETTIHRVDAECAPLESVIDPLIAADGIDELFSNMPRSKAFSPGVGELKGAGSLGFLALDRALGPDTAWRVDLLADGFEVRRGTAGDARDADAFMSGPPEQLLLLLYGRIRYPSPGLALTGDSGLLGWWVDNSALG